MTLFQLASYIYYYKKNLGADQNLIRCYKWSGITVATKPPLKMHFKVRVTPSPALKMIFNFILEIYLIQKNSTADGPALVGGLPAGSHVRTSL